MEPQVTPPRVSYERLAVEAAVRELSSIVGVEVHRGQGAGNRFSVTGWATTPSQAFQFGDLRFEADDATIVVEYESAAGVTNLVKYWPLLVDQAARAKKLVIVHVFQVAGPGDYLSHRLLWDFLVDKMTDDLRSRGMKRPADWDARLFTYRRGEIAEEAIDFIRTAI